MLRPQLPSLVWALALGLATAPALAQDTSVDGAAPAPSEVAEDVTPTDAPAEEAPAVDESAAAIDDSAEAAPDAAEATDGTAVEDAAAEGDAAATEADAAEAAAEGEPTEGDEAPDDDAADAEAADADAAAEDDVAPEEMAEDVYEDDLALEGELDDGSDELESDEPSLLERRIVAFVATGVSAASLGVGSVFGFLAWQQYQCVSDVLTCNETLDDPIVGTELFDARADIEQKALIADMAYLFAAAAALVAVTGYVRGFIFTGVEEDDDGATADASGDGSMDDTSGDEAVDEATAPDGDADVKQPITSWPLPQLPVVASQGVPK